eukprot:360772-Prymnesium_polylepis.1
MADRDTPTREIFLSTSPFCQLKSTRSATNPSESSPSLLALGSGDSQLLWDEMVSPGAPRPTRNGLVRKETPRHAHSTPHNGPPVVQLAGGLRTTVR